MVHDTQIMNSPTTLQFRFLVFLVLKLLKQKEDKNYEIWHLQIKIHPQTSIAPKYNVFYSNNKVSDHTLTLVLWLLLFQLSLKVTSPLNRLGWAAL